MLEKFVLKLYALKAQLVSKLIPYCTSGCMEGYRELSRIAEKRYFVNCHVISVIERNIGVHEKRAIGVCTIVTLIMKSCRSLLSESTVGESTQVISDILIGNEYLLAKGRLVNLVVPTGSSIIVCQLLL